LAARGTMPLPQAVLDGLRGIAILWVLAFHLSWLTALQLRLSLSSHTVDLTYLLRSGWLGVELFFFISGFCIFYPYTQHRFGYRPRQTVSDFALRRAFKIFPSYYLSLVVVIVLGPFLFFPSRNIFWQAISHVFFAFNFSSATTTALNGVLWSLAIEVQFYVLFPLICLAFERSAAVTFVAMSAIAVLYRFWSSACCDTTSAVRYQLPAFLDFFACGMLASLIFSYGMSRGINTEGSSKAWWTLASVASLTAVIVLVRYVPDAIGRGDALFYLAAAFLILAVTTAFSKSWWQGIFSNKILVFLSLFPTICTFITSSSQ